MNDTVDRNIIGAPKIQNKFGALNSLFFQYCDSNNGLLSVAPLLLVHCTVTVIALDLLFFIIHIIFFFFFLYCSLIVIALPTTTITIVFDFFSILEARAKKFLFLFAIRFKTTTFAIAKLEER